VIAGQSGVAVGSTPEAFAQFVQTERRRYETIVRDSGMTVE